MTHLIDEARISSDDLLKAAERLSPPEFERFATKIITLRAHRHAPSFARNEARLISKINRGLPPKLRARLDALTSRRIAGTISDEELAELKQVSEKAEKVELQRIKDLAALARIRNINLIGVMRQLGIRAPEYA